MDNKIKLTTGKRKRAVSRVRLTSGEKRIIINGKPLEVYPKIVQLKVLEPLIVSGEDAYDIKINASGGGFMAQAEASAQGIAKALVKLKGDDLKKSFLEYDRHLIVQDVRRTEPHKPSRSKKGPRRHKQRSKR